MTREPVSPEAGPANPHGSGAPAPYPLVFEPILKEKVWGGSRLRDLGKSIPEGVRIGESWELADLQSTSVSGGGGGDARSRIVNGGLAGRTLADAMALWDHDLLGPARPTAQGGFPLLVKFLDARENLSVQVHPSPGYAAAHPECHLKTECWYIVEADAGAELYVGLTPGLTREALAGKVEDGSLVNDLIAVPAVPGDCHTLPSGTCHALGAGVLVAEIQTPSDTTFRIHDWGRAGRELHVQAALECIDLGPAPPARRGYTLAETEFFSVFEWRLGSQPCPRAIPEAGPAPAMVLMALDGGLNIDGVHVPPGGTALIPSACNPGIGAERNARALCVLIH